MATIFATLVVPSLPGSVGPAVAVSTMSQRKTLVFNTNDLLGQVGIEGSCDGVNFASVQSLNPE
ncbi:MAG: hypothetical protein L0220_24675, partial [Acidobacteria bacterium]|nr:hypothetical protein [Acidobacteriota bacterium]